MMKRQPRREQSGFTLIELLVVVVILGILAAVVVFAVRGSSDKGFQAATDTDERILRTALELYCANSGSYPKKPDPMAQLVDEKYLSSPSGYYRLTTGGTGSGNCPGTGFSHYTLDPLKVIEQPDDFPGAWVKIASGDLKGISCKEADGATTCVAVGVGGAILRGTKATDAPTVTWSDEGSSAIPNDLYAVSCSDPETCTAVGSNETILRRTSASANWSDQSRPAGVRTTATLNGVSCPSTQVCVAVGAPPDAVIGGISAPPVILTTPNGGATWTDGASPALNPLAAVDCPNTLVCFASGYAAGGIGNVIVSVDAGASWAKQFSPTPFDALGASCTTASHCVLVDNAGGSQHTVTAGSSWAYDPLAFGDSMNGVSCRAGTGAQPELTSTCFAVGYRGAVGSSTDGGLTWVPETLVNPIDSSSDLWAVSCTASACRAVASSGYVLKR